MSFTVLDKGRLAVPKNQSIRFNPFSDKPSKIQSKMDKIFDKPGLESFKDDCKMKDNDLTCDFKVFDYDYSFASTSNPVFPIMKELVLHLVPRHSLKVEDRNGDVIETDLPIYFEAQSTFANELKGLGLKTADRIKNYERTSKGAWKCNFTFMKKGTYSTNCEEIKS